MSSLRLAIAFALSVSLIACGPAGAQQVSADGRFQRDPALMKAKQAQIVAAIRQENPQMAAQLQQSFNQDIVAAVAPAFRAYGYSTEDAVDMTAGYWITAWEASHGVAGTETDPAVARGVRAQLAGVMGPGLKGQSSATKQDIADTMLLQMLIADARMKAAKQEGPQAVKTMSDTIHREAAAILKTDLRAVEMTAKGFAPVGDAAGRAASPADNAAPAAGSGKSAAVEGAYFRAIYGLGATISFEPIILFGNGDYVELDETPLADLNAASDKARSPARWGRWRKQGGTFLLTNSKGRTNDYQLGKGNFFPAFAAQQGPRLSGTYSNTTGGGDYIVGGSVTTLAVDRIRFNPDGSFTQGKSAGGIAPNAAMGNRSSASGKWRLDGSALELAYADGRRVRTSFLWGASGSPPKPDADMAFIGGDVFTRDD